MQYQGHDIPTDSVRYLQSFFKLSRFSQTARLPGNSNESRLLMSTHQEVTEICKTHTHQHEA